MNAKSMLIPYLCLGGLISAPVWADADLNPARSDTSSANIHPAEATTEDATMAEDRQAMEGRGEVRTNAYWDEEEEENLADEGFEVKASYDPTDDASPAELQADGQDMPVERRYREEITVEEILPGE